MAELATMWIRNGTATHGDVLVDCTLIGKSDHAVFARTNGTYPHAEFVLIDCKTKDIPARGWDGLERGPSTYVRYWESGTRNLDDLTPADTSDRAKGSRVLDRDKDAALIGLYSTPSWVLGGWDPLKRLSKIVKKGE